MGRILSQPTPILRPPFTGRDVFTASGTWTRPTGVDQVWVTLTGGGGDNGVSEGCAGATIWRRRVAVTGNVTVTIGAAGTSNGPGGSTSFGTLSVAGGLGGNAQPAGSASALRALRQRVLQTSGTDAFVKTWPILPEVLACDPVEVEGVELAGLLGNPSTGYAGFWSHRTGASSVEPVLGDVYYGRGSNSGGSPAAIAGVCIVEY